MRTISRDMNLMPKSVDLLIWELQEKTGCSNLSSLKMYAMERNHHQNKHSHF